MNTTDKTLRKYLNRLRDTSFYHLPLDMEDIIDMEDMPLPFEEEDMDDMPLPLTLEDMEDIIDMDEEYPLPLPFPLALAVRTKNDC